MQDVIDIALKAVKKLGFDLCGWQSQLLRLPQKNPCIITTAEDEVHQKNVSGGYANAPIPTHCSKTIVPAIWTGKHEGVLFDQDPELFEEFFGWGHKGGWAQSVMEGAGRFSIFYANSSQIMSQTYFENEVNFHLEWITTAVHSAMSHARNKRPIILSNREKEVLRWIGDGKTADQTAQILSLSIDTIHFHLRNAMMKLDAPNKTAAVVNAIFLGLLHC